jgi:hypothetical protein
MSLEALVALNESMPASSATLMANKPFNGSNFNLWRLRLQQALMHLNAWHAIEPESDTTEKDEKAEKKALFTIISNIDIIQLALVQECTTARAMWMKLHDLLASKSISNRLFLRQQFLGLKMSVTGSIVSHIGKVKSVAVELRSAGLETSDIARVETF